MSPEAQGPGQGRLTDREALPRGIWVLTPIVSLQYWYRGWRQKWEKRVQPLSLV